MGADIASHWDASYRAKGPSGVSWFEAVPKASLALIDRAGLDSSAAIIDAGGGASRLAGELLIRGYTDVSVADVSPAALRTAQAELGPASARIQWVEADVRIHAFGRRFDLWHDRAVFHFMVDEADRESYLATMRRALNAGGYLVMATFGPEGPTRCSGLPVERYDAARLAAMLGDEFALLEQTTAIHRTPGGAEQQFQYALFRRRG